jgi:hypothetical protein
MLVFGLRPRRRCRDEDVECVERGSERSSIDSPIIGRQMDA